ncbi:hypothetical protein [[Phormidium] sp. ETS-05]|uniref:hypothetical protein n=1 Tax=[Phormidium] sp. ETS-05 TaxID=222819 RepID=UPI0018EF1BA1|nr:hypothetical protein [[Phormidium] sp. ETS-05]
MIPQPLETFWDNFFILTSKNPVSHPCGLLHRPPDVTRSARAIELPQQSAFRCGNGSRRGSSFRRLLDSSECDML